MFNLVIFNTPKFRSRNHFFGVSFLIFILFSALCNIHLMAQGNLQIAPHRVVFDEKTKIIDVNLVNVGQDSANYSISFLHYRMTENGGVEEITTPDAGQNFADKNIRFFPRSIRLGPNESQIVKIQVIKSELLAPGEYRSHLYFRSLPKPVALGEENTKKDTTITVKIVPIFGISIPVIIKVGESTTTLKLTDLKLAKDKNGNNKLFFIIHRAGNMSVIGDISILHIAPNGTETKIGLENEVVVYTPNLLRRMMLDVENKTAVDLTKGIIRVSYTTQSDIRPIKLAEAELAL